MALQRHLLLARPSETSTRVSISCYPQLHGDFQSLLHIFLFSPAIPIIKPRRVSLLNKARRSIFNLARLDFQQPQYRERRENVGFSTATRLKAGQRLRHHQVPKKNIDGDIFVSCGLFDKHSDREESPGMGPIYS